MGLKLRGAVRCGRCGKPRGIRHTCVTRIGRRPRPHRVQSPVTWECPSCHKTRGLRHTCGNSGDFKARKRKAATDERRSKRAATRRRQADRRKQAAADRRARERARKKARKKRTSPPRPRGESHEPGTCGDRDCPRYGCVAYWRGMENCPGPHGHE